MLMASAAPGVNGIEIEIAGRFVSLWKSTRDKFRQRFAERAPVRSTRGTACALGQMPRCIFGTAGARVRSKRPSEPLTRPRGDVGLPPLAALGHPRKPLATFAARSALAIPTRPKGEAAGNARCATRAQATGQGRTRPLP
jgi:hypothetical protein